MSKTQRPKRRHGCAVGCALVAILILLVLGVVALALFYSPAVDKLTRRLDSSDTLAYEAMYSVDGEIDPDAMTSRARQTYLDLQSCYAVYMKGDEKAPSDEAEEEDEASEEGLRDAEIRLMDSEESQNEGFACSAVVEYYSKGKSSAKADYAYGMVLYTDSVSTAFRVFYAYYQTFSKNHSEAAESDYYLFLRGNALVVGNLQGLRYFYLNNII